MIVTWEGGFSIRESSVSHNGRSHGSFRVLMRNGAEPRPVRLPSNLIRRFADMEANEDSIIGFSNQYGELGSEPLYMARGDNPEVPPGSVVELVNDWLAYMFLARQAVQLFEAIKTADWDTVCRVLQSEEYLDYMFLDDRLSDGIAHKSSGPSMVGRALHYSSSALWALESLARAGLPLWAESWSALGWFINLFLKNLGPGLGYDITAGCLKFYPPITLIGAMWYQFAETVASESQDYVLEPKERVYIGCEVCGKPFSAERSTRRICSNACRQKLYRMRKKKASGP